MKKLLVVFILCLTSSLSSATEEPKIFILSVIVYVPGIQESFFIFWEAPEKSYYPGRGERLPDDEITKSFTVRRDDGWNYQMGSSSVVWFQGADGFDYLRRDSFVGTGGVPTDERIVLTTRRLRNYGNDYSKPYLFSSFFYYDNDGFEYIGYRADINFHEKIQTPNLVDDPGPSSLFLKSGPTIEDKIQFFQQQRESALNEGDAATVSYYDWAIDYLSGEQ